MRELLTTIIPIILILCIVYFSFILFSSLFESSKKKRFILKSSLENLQKTIVSAPKENKSILQSFTSFSNYKLFLERKVLLSRKRTTTNRVLIQQLVMTGTILLITMVLYLLSDMFFYWVISIPLIVISLIIPIKQLDLSKARYERQMRIQLPQYLSALSMLLQTYTPLEAIRSSIKYAPPIMKLYVEELVAQIELYPASTKPYQDFAKRVQLIEAKEFMIALQQIMNVNALNAESIIESQVKNMRSLEKQAYAELIEDRPYQVQMYMTPFLLTLLCSIFVFLVVLVFNAFTLI